MMSPLEVLCEYTYEIVLANQLFHEIEINDQIDSIIPKFGIRYEAHSKTFLWVHYDYDVITIGYWSTQTTYDPSNPVEFEEAIENIRGFIMRAKNEPDRSTV